MKKLTVTRTVTMPDMVRIARFERAPELGPKVLFLSGGTALNDISRALKKFTHNSIHLITPFDSGGSSAVLRKAFDMPAIGDLRSRLMALADDTISGHPEVFQLFAHRLSKSAKRKDLLAKLKAMTDGKEPRVAAIKNPMRRLIQNHLLVFLDNMPDKMDLRGASIGNLILAGGYLNNNRQLDPVLFMFSKLVNVQGQVRPIVDDNLHLAVKLTNGKSVIGQHNLTGKETTPLASAITDFYLVDGLKTPLRAHAQLPKKNRKLIREAELICYPPGSFYSSLSANLLAGGVGRAIAETPCPKIYVPNLGEDPEQIGMNIDQSIFKLIDILRRDAGADRPVRDLLSFVLIDSGAGKTLKPATHKALGKEGVRVIDTRLITPQSTPYYEPQLLVAALLSLV